MELSDRLGWLLLGMAIGFVLGYIVARLREIKEEVDTVLQEVAGTDEHRNNQKGERGAFRLPSFNSMALVFVLLITAYAAFSSAKINQQLDDTVSCLTVYNTNQNVALSARDQAISTSAQAEIDLWAVYQDLYKKASQPDVPPERLAGLQDELAAALKDYRDLLIETQMVRNQYEYDDPDILRHCERDQDE